jgi:hypothetical protein
MSPLKLYILFLEVLVLRVLHELTVLGELNMSGARNRLMCIPHYSCLNNVEHTMHVCV